MEHQNSLLRSAYAICKREGKNIQLILFINIHKTRLLSIGQG